MTEKDVASEPVPAVVGIADEECAESGGCADCGKKDCAYKKEPK